VRELCLQRRALDRRYLLADIVHRHRCAVVVPRVPSRNRLLPSPAELAHVAAIVVEHIERVIALPDHHAVRLLFLDRALRLEADLKYLAIHPDGGEVL
jgi:hypothetical protein